MNNDLCADRLFVRGLHWIAIERNNDASQQEDSSAI